MANPRKFSEKIALHNQKQAEETAAFEAILRDVNAATRGSFQKSFCQQNQQLQLHQNIMPQYRGGSLPNVNQMAVATNSGGMDLQNALQQRDDLHGAAANRVHPRDRGRQQVGPLRSRAFQMEKSRADCSPYGSPYLCPPADTSWRRVNRHLNGVNYLARTNSDSAIHTSTMGGGSGSGDLSPNTPPMHRRIHEMLLQRPKSCEVPNINIYPSAGQDPQLAHIPISNNTGSLPDLSESQFSSPLTTPIDVDDQATYTANPASLSPTTAHHLNMASQQHQTGSPAQSPGSQRRPQNQGRRSPLVLPSNGSQPLMPHSPPVSNIDPSTTHIDPRMRHHYLLYMQQQQQQQQRGHRGPGSDPTQISPTDPTPHNHEGAGPPRVPPTHLGPVPKVCVTSHENDETSEVAHSIIQVQQTNTNQGLTSDLPPFLSTFNAYLGPEAPSMTQYRSNNVGETGCQSPTSPRSQPSYSPSQSPGLPPQSWPQTSAFEMDTFHVQQQQTNALQHQFEQFNMLHDNQQRPESSEVISSNGTTSVVNSTPHTSTVSPEWLYMAATSDASSPQFFPQTIQTTANNKIPEIVLSGMGDGFSLPTIAGMADGAFDLELYGVPDEYLKQGLDPLDLDGLQLLDSSHITDADTENSFRLDQL